MPALGAQFSLEVFTLTFSLVLRTRPYRLGQRPRLFKLRAGARFANFTFTEAGPCRPGAQHLARPTAEAVKAAQDVDVYTRIGLVAFGRVCTASAFGRAL